MKNTELEPMTKPGAKFTLLVVGGGMMGVDVRKTIVSRGWVRTKDGEMLGFSEPRGRKIYNLEKVLRCGVIVLRGHEVSRPVFESHARVENGFQSFILNGVGGRFIDYNEEGTQALIGYIKQHMVLHTLTSESNLTLLKELRGDSDQRTVADPYFQEKLLNTLGPRCHIESPSVRGPERKSLLTDVMKAKLLEARDRTPQPIYKIFSPEGSATWLLCSMEDDGDTLWAVCDLGLGCVEYGTVSLSDLETGRGPRFKMPFERDIHFDGRNFNMSEALGKVSLMV